MAYIDADKLITFANNHKNKMIDANDIARFPTADVVPKSEVEKIFEGILSLIKAEKFHHINFGDLIYVADIERIFAELKKKCTESEDTK